MCMPLTALALWPVSYTHLDVYKRQPMHMAATCLHYGQEAFEGLKAFRGKDGKVRIFRLEENAARLQSTCRGILMPCLLYTSRCV